MMGTVISPETFCAAEGFVQVKIFISKKDLLQSNIYAILLLGRYTKEITSTFFKILLLSWDMNFITFEVVRKKLKNPAQMKAL